MHWLERLAGVEEPPPPPPIPPPDYELPPVRRTTREEDERAEQAVRTLEAYVRARTGRRPPPPKP